MCGIAGFIASPAPSAELSSRAVAMADALRHRGPDDSGIWTDPAAGIALGFRRLSILDLSEAGHQPMASVSGRYVMIFNGEVYNHEELRREVTSEISMEFRGHSDTEVMLAAIERWGLESAVRRFNGMFALALWDRRERRLHLVRDRVGVKPLYYGTSGGTFLFSSELSALRRHPAFDAEIDHDALSLLMQYSYIPAPFSIYRKFRKLPAGTILTIGPGRYESVPEPYWSAKEVYEKGEQEPFSGSEQEAVDQLEHLVRDSVRLRMVADVPLGVFLSGGVDSSTVTALMQAQSARAIKTFSIGFEEDEYNEAVHAAAVARHLGTDHTEMYVTAQQALATIPELPRIYDEPFADSSQIPTYLVSALARRRVTVSLSGDGGDELFGGYNRYFLGRRVWRAVSPFPNVVRRFAATLLGAISAERWNQFRRKLPTSTALPADAFGDKIHKLARVLRAGDPDLMYFETVSQWSPSVVRGSGDAVAAGLPAARPQISDPIQRMMYFDLISYLPDDILVKTDRASMAVSLEAREPLLDYRLVEFAASLPMRLKLRGSQGKWILRQLLYRYVPESLIERPKMGFGVPLDHWLRGPLREWAEDLLSEDRLPQEGFFDPAAVRHKWIEHLSGRRDWQHYLWDVLMFNAWFDAQRKSSPVVATARALTISVSA
jgi:asparagine synthase (glutamine-hydrolysing)